MTTKKVAATFCAAMGLILVLHPTTPNASSRQKQSSPGKTPQPGSLSRNHLLE